MCEFFLPLMPCSFFSSVNCLYIMKGQGQAYLKLWLNLLHGSPGCLMGTHYENVTLWCSRTDKVFRLLGAKNPFVFKSLPEHVLKHLVKIHAHLSSALHAVRLFIILIFLALCHHLTLIALCNCCHLKSHVGFIYCDYIGHQISQLFCHISTISGKIPDCVLIFPSSLFD